MKIENIHLKFKACSAAATDTRKLPKDCMFFALKGENFDGNKFVQKAFNDGAKYCVVDNADAVINDNCILVKDVLSTLQELAKFHRIAINVPIISLTGSNGKTTTKELIKAVLETTYSVKATIGNLNNHIGVPLTLLSFTEALDFGIVEMGANHQKEIEFLCNIAQPDYGLITNFGKAHLEGFGSIEGVIKAKSELYNYLIHHNKKALINTDDSKQVKQINHYTNTITFGSHRDNDYTITFKNANPYVTLSYGNLEIESQLIGNYNYGNLAASVAIGAFFKVSALNIKEGIEAYQPDNNRSEIIKKGTSEIILDAYNANPTSMLAALNNIIQLNTTHKHLFLGDMFELGLEAKEEHQNIVDYITTNFTGSVYLIGENFHQTTDHCSCLKFQKFEDLIPTLKTLELNNATVLIKGSRGMALERILEYL